MEISFFCRYQNVFITSSENIAQIAKHCSVSPQRLYESNFDVIKMLTSCIHASCRNVARYFPSDSIYKRQDVMRRQTHRK